MSTTPWVLRFPSYVAVTDAALSPPREAHHNPDFRASTFCSGGHAGRGPKVGDRGCPALWVGESTGKSLADSAKTGRAKVTLTAQDQGHRGDRDAVGRAAGIWRRPPTQPDREQTHRRPKRSGGERRTRPARSRAVLRQAQAPPRPLLRDGDGAFSASAVHKDNLEPVRSRQRRDQPVDARPSRDLPKRTRRATAHPVVTMLPMPLFLGEGAPLYAGGLGTVSLCPVPSYLLQEGSRTKPS